jgi:hypothetical protein
MRTSRWPTTLPCVVQAVTQERGAAAVAALLTSSAGLALMTAAPALADEVESTFSQGSYNVTLGLFLFALPGLYSLIKRSTKAKVRRSLPREYRVGLLAETEASPV